MPTGTKRSTLTVAVSDDRSSSETNLVMQKSSRDEEYKIETNGSDLAQYSYTPGNVGSLDEDREMEDNASQLPNHYELGKFISMSDTMLQTEERANQYDSAGPTSPTSSDTKDLEIQDKLVQLDEPVTVPAPKDDIKVEEKQSEDEGPIHYQPGKFVSQTTSTTPTPDLDETREDMTVEKTVPPAPTVVNPEREHIPEAEADKPTTERASTPPSNRWFDAYMKCKALHGHQKKPNSTAAKKLPANKPPPVEKPQVESPQVKNLPVATAPQTEKDNFEKVQKITPSKSHKWLEAMQKYRALKSNRVQNTSRPSTNIQEGDEPTQSSVKTPQKSAEEPTFASLAQRAQVFGGMRKRPPLRRTKSFRVSSDNASPLATGLSRPTRVLKKQVTVSFT